MRWLSAVLVFAVAAGCAKSEESSNSGSAPSQVPAARGTPASEKDTKTTTAPTGSFSKVHLQGSTDVALTEGTPHAVVIEGDNAANVITETAGDTLHIRCKHDDSYRDLCQGTTSRVTAPAFSALTVDGSGGMVGKTRLSGASLDVNIAGSSDVELDLEVGKVTLSIQGSGNATLRGRSTELIVELQGSGNLAAAELAADSATIEIAGSGSADVHADKTLAVSIAGSGEVTYAGNAAVTKNIAGSGAVRPRP